MNISWTIFHHSTDFYQIYSNFDTQKLYQMDKSEVHFRNQVHKISYKPLWGNFIVGLRN